MVARRFVVAALLLAACPASAQQVELLDFYLPTCGPCQAMAPTVDRLEAEGVRVRRIDGARQPGLTARMQVMSYPTFIAVANGMEVGRLVGMAHYEQLRRLVASATGPARDAVRPVAQTFARGSSRDAVATVGGDWGPGQPAPQPSAHAELLAATARLTIEDGSSRAYGTGTIVDARQGEALLVTCAHLFRYANGQPIDASGRLSVELYGAGRVSQRVAGTLVSYDFDADVALVAIRPRGQVKTVRVAPSAGELRIGDPVRSVGCDRGADPTVRESRVEDLDRYNGPPNIEVAGAPVQGRSGGGLFDSAGRLVGVCNFADEQDDQGIYAGVASIHRQLDRVGLAELYQGAAPEPPAAAFATTAAPTTVEPIPRAPAPIVRGQNPAAGAGGLDPVERATLGELAKRGAGGEVVVLIRGSEPGASTEVMTLDTASPAFLEALRDLGVATPLR